VSSEEAYLRAKSRTSFTQLNFYVKEVDVTLTSKRIYALPVPRHYVLDPNQLGTFWTEDGVDGTGIENSNGCGALGSVVQSHFGSGLNPWHIGNRPIRY
jgi:hypothetical protein